MSKKCCSKCIFFTTEFESYFKKTMIEGSLTEKNEALTLMAELAGMLQDKKEITVKFENVPDNMKGDITNAIHYAFRRRNATKYF